MYLVLEATVAYATLICTFYYYYYYYYYYIYRVVSEIYAFEGSKIAIFGYPVVFNPPPSDGGVPLG